MHPRPQSFAERVLLCRAIPVAQPSPHDTSERLAAVGRAAAGGSPAAAQAVRDNTAVICAALDGGCALPPGNPTSTYQPGCSVCERV